MADGLTLMGSCPPTLFLSPNARATLQDMSSVLPSPAPTSVVQPQGEAVAAPQASAVGAPAVPEVAPMHGWPTAPEAAEHSLQANGHPSPAVGPPPTSG